jgi:chlorobactene glucosyltransferase
VSLSTFIVVLEIAVVALAWVLALKVRSHRQPSPSVGRHEADLQWGRVSIIVPIRNEADKVQECIESLLQQDYPDFEVIAVDDCSEDETPERLRRFADDPRFTIVQGEPLPAGWMGKAHAIVQGFRVATGRWLVFTDADTHHAPWLLTSVIHSMRHSSASFGTVLARQQYPNRWVWITGLAVFSWLQLFWNSRDVEDVRKSACLLNGQFVVFSRSAYEAVGTHAAVREFSSTDASLGYLAKLQGWTPLVIHGPGLKTTMYTSFGDAFRGWSRSIVNMNWTAHGRIGGTIATMVAAATIQLLWVSPWIALATGVWIADAILITAAVAHLGAALAMARHLSGGTRASVKHFLAMPASGILFLVFVSAGLVSAWSRGGTVWKGRIVGTPGKLPPWQPPSQRREDCPS